MNMQKLLVSSFLLFLLRSVCFRDLGFLGGNCFYFWLYFSKLYVCFAFQIVICVLLYGKIYLGTNRGCVKLF